ncbi:UDP binding domain-containing protein [Sphingobacterium sp. T2]|uniref:UDP binding domain-containing protein n=1 Tax=Sphingobacterium sp. T2 TaxID=1590596 RepID=UPI000AF3900B|nr:UDP binding domain-containing protein [Sphingobacterium sp. T2]
MPAEKVFIDLDNLNSRPSEENRTLVTVEKDPYLACKDAHAIAILTEWDEFKDYDWKRIKEHMMKPAFIFDGRKLLNRKEMEALGFIYYAIG